MEKRIFNITIITIIISILSFGCLGCSKKPPIDLDPSVETIIDAGFFIASET